MPKDEGWVEDDPTVPNGWKVKEYVNKGGQKVTNFADLQNYFC